MPEQYFSTSPDAAHDIRVITVSVLDEDLTFMTDAGVFSKGALDEGSEILLKALPPLGGRVLDLGAGWGAIGLTLAKKYPDAGFVLSEINPRAMELCEKNRVKNRLENAAVVLSDAFSAVEGTFDTIITNPPIRAGKDVIYAMFDTSFERLNEGGRLFIVIRVKQGAASAVKHLEEKFASVRTIERKKGYHVIEATK